MKLPGWPERDRVKRQRVRSGYTSLRISKLTGGLVAELKKRHPYAGVDELLYFLLQAVLHASPSSEMHAIGARAEVSDNPDPAQLDCIQSAGGLHAPDASEAE